MELLYTEDVSDIPAEFRRTGTGAARRDPPWGYLPDAGLVSAVNVALLLGKPLLLTGDPGTGKTQLAHSLAWQLASRRRLNVVSDVVERFETKSSSVARDLFYTFDAISRFQAARVDSLGDGADNAHFITYNALGRALLSALPSGAVPADAPQDRRGPTQIRTVVLIDEIDKAPRDFPNDLLNEIDQMFFRIPELRNVQVGGPDVLAPEMRPIVVITSNSERNLPDPFLRRCIYYNIPFPEPPQLRQILLKRIPEFTATRGALLDDAMTFYARLRSQAKRDISPAELIDWLAFMLKAGASPDSQLAANRTLARAGLHALAKDPADQPTATAELESFLRG